MEQIDVALDGDLAMKFPNLPTVGQKKLLTQQLKIELTFRFFFTRNGEH